MAALLQVKALKAFYGQTQSLYDVGFSIEDGGITTLLGANGAGKTTTLRAICNMVRTEGSVRFDGKDINGMATEEIVRLRIAHVPEGRGTFTTLTVDENLRIAAYTRKDKRASGTSSSGCSATFRGSRSACSSRPAPCRAASSRCWRSPAP